MLIFVLQTLAEILAGGTSLTSTEQIDFSHPSNRKEEGAGPTLNLYIYDIRESKQMQHSGRQVERRLTGALQPTSVRISDRANRPSVRFSIRPQQKIAGGAITILISDSEPRALPEGTEGSPPPNTGEYFKVQIRREDETLEEYDNLTMNREPNAQFATYAIAALRNSLFVNIEDISLAGQPLARRPENGQYEVTPPTARVNWPPSWFDISMLLTVWDRTTLGEHHLMSEAISVLLRHRLLREEFLVSELRGYGNLNLTVSLEPQLEAGSLWSALTIPLRPALYLMVTVPFVQDKKPVDLVLERIFQMKNQVGNGSVETITRQIVIAGVVNSAVTNLPLVEAEIKVMGTQKSTNSSKEGLFYFENLSLGNYILLLNCQGYLPLQVNVLVDSQNCNFKEILLTPA